MESPEGAQSILALTGLPPVFYLRSADSPLADEPYRCQPIRRLRATHRDDLLLVSIVPSLVGSVFGTEGLDQVILASRWVGRTLFPISEWPLAVHVAAPPDPDQTLLRDGQLRSLVWAEIYPTEEAARAKQL